MKKLYLQTPKPKTRPYQGRAGVNQGPPPSGAKFSARLPAISKQKLSYLPLSSLNMSSISKILTR